MRSAAISSALFLSLVLLGCNSKPSTSSSGNDTGNSATNAPASSPTSSGQPSSSATTPAAPAPVEAEPLVVPAGTVVTVRLAQAVGSKISQPGQTFSATVATPVEVGGKTAIPAGAGASGTVVDAQPLGKIKGGAVLQLKLDSLRIGGADRPVQTSAVVRTEKGKGKRTAVLAGGGAGLGALIGGLAGGGKGAAIGALAGGGAGTAGAAYTGNKDIVLPAESALSFKLEQSIRIKQ
jgi:hypothetical protein